MFRHPPRDGHPHQSHQVHRSRHVDPRTDGGTPACPLFNLYRRSPPLSLSRNGVIVVQTPTGKPISKPDTSLPTSKSPPLNIPPSYLSYSKMESFIRSKYETRRWAMDGPPPSDPSILDGPAQSASNGDAAAAPLLDTGSSQASTPARPTHAPTVSLSAPRPASPSLQSPSTLRQNTSHSRSQSRQLLSAAVAGRVPVSSAPSQSQSPQSQQQPPQQKVEDDLFSLDFHAPPTSKPVAPQPPAKDVKQDILSLFSAAPSSAAPAQSIQPSNAFGQFASAQSSWDPRGGVSLSQTHGHGHTQSQSQGQQQISMIGTNGTGFWGVSSGWNGNGAVNATSANIWGSSSTTSTSTSTFASTNTTSTFNVMDSTDIWGGSTATATVQANGTHGLFEPQTVPAPKKDDAFGDLWGNFK